MEHKAKLCEAAEFLKWHEELLVVAECLNAYKTSYEPNALYVTLTKTDIQGMTVLQTENVPLIARGVYWTVNWIKTVAYPPVS